MSAHPMSAPAPRRTVAARSMVAPADSMILAIDPGYERSAFLKLRWGKPILYGIEPNDDLLTFLRINRDSRQTVVIEQIESYGMAVGREVFETVRWGGRFEEACHPARVVMLPRRAVKLNLCGDSRAKDPNIRAALIDRFGGTASIRKGGPLYGIHADVWSALAIAVTYSDQEGNR